SLPPISTLFPYTTLFRSYGFAGRVPVVPVLQQVQMAVSAAAQSSEVYYCGGDLQYSSYRSQRFAEQGAVAFIFPKKAVYLKSFADRKSTRLNSSHVKISY